MDISPVEFYSRYANDATLQIIDVREQLEFQTFNFGGRNIPLGELISNIEDLDISKTDEIAVICQRGLRSETARRLLVQHGYSSVRNLKGGLLAVQKHNIKSSNIQNDYKENK